ncbi:MAG: ATP-dependent helicase [Actinobacteria bacterium]|nr:ATP-dependent helicase [Actinomycetota bacterium]
MPVSIQLTLPQDQFEINPTAQQSAAIANVSGNHLLLGAAGSGRTTTALVAAKQAAIEFEVSNVWVIAANRSSAVRFRELLIKQDTQTAPRVFTISALAYAMLRAQFLFESAGEVNLAMLTGPQQESRIKNLIAELDINWPSKWSQAKQTKVFAADLRRFIDINRAEGLVHPDEQLLRVIKEFTNAMLEQARTKAEIDYTQANLLAAELLINPEFVAPQLFSPKAIIVDDLHDFDKAQLKLLVKLIEFCDYSFVTSNADAAVLGFRGVGIEITKQYRDEINPQTHLLSEVIRYGRNIGAVVQDFLPAQVAPDINNAEEKAIRKPSYRETNFDLVEYEVAASSAIRDSLIVDRIIKARVKDNLEFKEIAIIGRSFTTLSSLRRSLADAAVPVEFAPDNVALAADPAASKLISGLQLTVGDLQNKSNSGIVSFLNSEIVSMNSAQIRTTAQKLRALGMFGSTEDVLSKVIKNPFLLAEFEFDPVLQSIRRAAVILHTLIQKREKLSVAQMLWCLWRAQINPDLAKNFGYEIDDSWENWPTRLIKQAKLATATGRRADRDLDAVLALFDAADRADRHSQSAQSITEFISEISSQDAASEVLIQRAQSGVAVLTAHRARGREWRLVIVVDLQEGIWPAANVRESIILARDAAQQRLRLAEERRLAACAAATASEHLVISVIASKSDEGSAPSSLLDLDALPKPIGTQAPSLLTARGLIAQLRATAINPKSSPELRQAAISRLGFLNSLPDSRFLAANPNNWWFVLPQTQSEKSILNQEKKLEISGSMLESVNNCPTQWFFERKIGIKEQPIANTVIGITIHAVAEKMINQNLSLDQAIAELNRIWPAQVFDARWQAEVQLADATIMVKALKEWLVQNAHQVIGTEISFKVLHTETDVILVGKIDLLHRNPNDELEIVDFKTGSSKPSAADLQTHPQLGIYQLAAQSDTFLNPDQLPVVAQLLQIRLRNTKDEVTQQNAPQLNDDQWLIDEINQTKAHLFQEDLPARPGQQCRNCKVRTVCPAVPEGDQVSA